MESKTNNTIIVFPDDSIVSENQPKKEAGQEYQEDLVIVPPDGGWGWVVVFGAFLSFLLVDGIIVSFGVFLDNMAEDLKCSKSQVSTTAAINTGIFCMSGPFVASLVNKYGYIAVGVVGSLLAITSYLLTSISKSIYLIHITYGLLGGIGFGMINMPAIIAVGFYFEKWRGVATGIATCGSGLGGIILPLVLTMFLERVGWRQTFRILAVLIILTTLCALAFKPITPTRIKRVKVNPVISGNFFTTYHNKMYPTLSEVTEVPTITLLQPRKLTKSSEVMITSYASSSLKWKFKDDEAIEECEKTSETGSVLNASSQKHMKTLFRSKRRQREIPVHETRTFFGPIMRPMYRDDIFYNSSFNFLQRYRKTQMQDSQRSAVTFSKSNMEYHMSVTRVLTSREIDEEKICNLCTEAVKRTLATMLDYKLLQSPSFLLITLNAAFMCLGYFTIYVFVKDRAHEAGIPEEMTFWFISVIGLANTIGRIVYGAIASCPRVHHTWLTAFCLTIGGLATILSVHSDKASVQICFGVIFGSTVACVPVLRTLIIVDTLGLDKLTNAVGLILMFQGTTTLIGLLISGLLREATGDYKWTFYFSGSSIIIGGLIFIPLQKVAKWEKLREKARVSRK